MIYVMNHYEDRTESVKHELNLTDFDYSFVEIIEDEVPHFSLFKTVQSIIKNNYNEEYVVVVEDDLKLESSLNKKILYDLIFDAVNQEADVLLLGTSSVLGKLIGNFNLVKCDKFNGTVFTVYFKSSYDTILNNKTHMHLDDFLCYGMICYMAYPEIVSQKIFENRICQNELLIRNGYKKIKKHVK